MKNEIMALIAAYRFINSTDDELASEGNTRDDLVNDFHSYCPSLKELELSKIDFDKVDKWFSMYETKDICGVPYSEEDGNMWHVIELARWAREYI